MLDLGRTFLQSVERSPNAVALVDGPLQLTYLQWHERIEQLAAGLERLGLKHGDRVVVALQNRWEMASLHWACQFLGLVAVPINWRCKPEELDYCVTDSGARALFYEEVTAEATAASAAAQGIIRVALDGLSGASVAFEQLMEPVDQSYRLEARAASASDVSLILYTSGTTGKPKGVPRRHRHERAAALAHVAQNLYRHGERTLGVMPLYHTMGVRSLLAMTLTDGLFVCVRRWSAKRGTGVDRRLPADLPVSGANALSRPDRRCEVRGQPRPYRSGNSASPARR